MATAETPSAPRGGSRSGASTARTARPAKAGTKTATRDGRRAPAAAGSRTGKAARKAATSGRATSATRKSTASGRTSKAASKTAASRSVTVPLVNVRVPVLGVRVPGADTAKRETKAAADTIRSYLPPMDRLAYYGGLGAAAVLGVLEWPVAAAAGAGVWVATRGRGLANRAPST